MINLLIMVGIAITIAVPLIIVLRWIGFDEREPETLRQLQDAYWEYVSGEKGRGDTRHT